MLFNTAEFSEKFFSHFNLFSQPTKNNGYLTIYAPLRAALASSLPPTRHPKRKLKSSIDSSYRPPMGKMLSLNCVQTAGKMDHF
jgi:hypothetical protein